MNLNNYLRRMTAAGLILALGALAVRADPPQSVFQAATIETKSGMVTGFTAYTTDQLYELNTRKTEKRKSEVFIQEPPTEKEILGFLRAKPVLKFFPDLRKISQPKDMIVATQPRQAISQADIKSIRLSSHPLNGFQWYGKITEVSSRAADQLQTRPHFMCSDVRDGCCSHYYWLSYNPKVGKKQLGPLCSGPFKPYEDYERRSEQALKLPGVIRIEESTD